MQGGGGEEERSAIVDAARMTLVVAAVAIVLAFPFVLYYTILLALYVVDKLFSVLSVTLW